MKEIEILIKNFLLKLFLLFGKSKRKNNTNSFNENSKILFIRLNRIGDALVSTPVIHAVKEKFNCKTFILADKKNKIAFINNKDIDQLIIFEKGIKGFFKIKKFVEENNIDTIVDLHDDTSTTVSFLIAICKAQNKFGLEKENNKIYTKTVPRIDASKFHIIERNIELTKLFGFEVDKFNIKIKYEPTEESKKSVEKFLGENFKVNKFLLGINISAGSPARFWGIERYKQLIKFLENYNFNILLLSTPAEMHFAEKISEGKTVVYSPNFDEFAAVISKINLLISPDTAAVHLASAFKTPVFGLYVHYDTEDVIWSPYGCKFEAVITKEPTLENVSFEEVEKKLKPFIEKFL